MSDIHEVNLSAIDLNLLVVVDAVLREKSATRAAARLHLTQSAVSSALRRARSLFSDRLVVRSSRGFQLTSAGVALAPRLQHTLAEVRALLGEERGFEPQSTTRRFTVAATDAIGAILWPELVGALRSRMPKARLRGVTLDRVVAAGGLEHADVDMLVGVPPTVPAGCEVEDLFLDPMVCIVRDGHPRVGGSMSLRTYAEVEHVELALFGEPDDRVDRALAARGVRRAVAASTPHVMGLAFIVARSDLVATVTASVAGVAAGPLGLRVLQPPVELDPLRVRHLWHRTRGEDPGHELLRAAVRDAARALGLRARSRPTRAAAASRSSEERRARAPQRGSA